MLTDHQAAQVGNIAGQQIAIITGGAGTGKSTTVRHLVDDLVRRGNAGDILIVAPTNKAVQRLREIFSYDVPIRLATIHSALEARPLDGDGWKFERNALSPLDEKIVFVDESSMVENSVFARLLEACRRDATIILVGDHQQLPPVGRGQSFCDLIDSQVVPTARLTEVLRNAGRLAEVAESISGGGRFLLPPYLATPFTAENNIVAIKTESHRVPDGVVTAINHAVRDGYSLAGIQVIVATHRFRCQINREYQSEFNGDGERTKFYLNQEAGTGKERVRLDARVGDRVIRTGGRQSYPVVGTKETAIAVNGDMGGIVAVDHDTAHIAIDGGPTIAVAERALNGWDCGYAITGHKSQGSEWPVVIIALAAGDSFNFCRRWAYTAVTRARERCYVVGVTDELKRMAQNDGEQRKSFLKERIRKHGRDHQ